MGQYTSVNTSVRALSPKAPLVLMMRGNLCSTAAAHGYVVDGPHRPIWQDAGQHGALLSSDRALSNVLDVIKYAVAFPYETLRVPR